MTPTVEQGLVYLRAAELELQRLYEDAYRLARTGELTVSIAEAIDAQAEKVHQRDIEAYQFIKTAVQSAIGTDIAIPLPERPQPITPLARDVEATGAKAAPALAIPVAWVAIIVAAGVIVLVVGIIWTITAIRDTYATAEDTVRFRICLDRAVAEARRTGVPVTSEMVESCGTAVHDASSAPEPTAPVDWTRIGLYGVGGLVALGAFGLLLNWADRRIGGSGPRLQPYNKYER